MGHFASSVTTLLWFFLAGLLLRKLQSVRNSSSCTPSKCSTLCSPSNREASSPRPSHATQHGDVSKPLLLTNVPSAPGGCCKSHVRLYLPPSQCLHCQKPTPRRWFASTWTPSCSESPHLANVSLIFGLICRWSLTEVGSGLSREWVDHHRICEAKLKVFDFFFVKSLILEYCV